LPIATILQPKGITVCIEPTIVFLVTVLQYCTQPIPATLPPTNNTGITFPTTDTETTVAAVSTIVAPATTTPIHVLKQGL
jgi:hypothetical protein